MNKTSWTYSIFFRYFLVVVPLTIAGMILPLTTVGMILPLTTFSQMYVKIVEVKVDFHVRPPGGGMPFKLDGNSGHLLTHLFLSYHLISILKGAAL